MRETDICEAPLPADLEQAIDELFALRRMLWNERQVLASKVERCERLRRELSAVSAASAAKDKEIVTLKDEIKELKSEVANYLMVT